MAADVVKTSLEIDDKASAPLQTAEQAASEYAETTNGLTEAEKRLLAQMLATQKALEDRARVTGLSVSQIQALERGVKQQAASAAEAAEETTRVAVAQTAAAASADDAGKAMERASFGAKQLRFQLADIGVQLVGGMNPFVILAQQGPDVAYAFEAGGGAANTMRAAFGGLITQAGALAPILAGVALVVAAVGTAYAVTANHLESAIGPTQQINDLLREQGSVAGRLSGELENTAGQWAKFTEKMAETALAIERINTGLVNVNAAMAKAESEVTDQGGRALLATSQRIAELERLIAAEQEAQDSGRLNFEETEKSIAAEAKHSTELAKQRALFAQRKADFEQAKDAAAQLAEYNAELANSETFVAERTKQAEAAKKAKTEADKAAIAWTEEAKIVNEEFYAALERHNAAVLAGTEAFAAQATAQQRMVEHLTPLIEAVDQLAPPETLDRLTQLQLLLLQLNTEAARSPEAAAALQDSIGRVNAALAAERAGSSASMGGFSSARGATSFVGGVESVGAGLNAVSGSGGDVFAMLGGGASALGGMLGAAGIAGAAAAVAPVAAVAAALGALVKFTDAIVVTGEERSKGETSIIKQAESFLTDFFDQFAQLPEALAEQLGNVDFTKLGESFDDAVSGFLVGLVYAAPTLIEALIRSLLFQQSGISNALIGAIPDVIAAVIEVFGDPKTWRDMASAIVEAVKETITTSLDVRRNARDASTAAVAGGLRGAGDRLRGMGASITINGVVGDTREVVRTMRDRLGTLGSGLSFDRDGRWST